ncbi:MAG: hypothetical protein GY850_42380 [bacterium]|nr:hypothetical protein [bacterium]
METRPQSQGIDIGADEFSTCIVDMDGDDDVDGTDLAAFSSDLNEDCLVDFCRQFGYWE